MRLLVQSTTTEIKYGRNEEVNFSVKTENKQAQFQIVYTKGDKKQDQRETKGQTLEVLSILPLKLEGQLLLLEGSCCCSNTIKAKVLISC